MWKRKGATEVSVAGQSKEVCKSIHWKVDQFDGSIDNSADFVIESESFLQISKCQG